MTLSLLSDYFIICEDTVIFVIPSAKETSQKGKSNELQR